MSGDTSQPSIFTIASDQAFLPALVQAMFRGELIRGFDPLSNPSGLADAVFYLPTRRAARALALEISTSMERMGGRPAVILPRIRTLGDLDEEESLENLSELAGEIPEILRLSARKIDRTTRQLVLANLARGWINAMSPETRTLFEEELIIIPSSSSDALRLAAKLADFMDQVETEEVDWSAIKNLQADDFSNWWQLTLQFLEIVMTHWPNYLTETGQINPAEFRRKITDFRIRKLSSRKSDGPVIAAGSTGSVPSTARLMKQIASLPSGAVVLPGLDVNLPEKVVRRIQNADEMIADGIASTHPQYAMIKFLQMAGIRHVDVPLLMPKETERATRTMILADAMLPAEDTGDWQKLRNRYLPSETQNAFSKVSLIEASSERQEALAIALVLRESLENPKRTAALVTPDRQLARRVSAELERFNIAIDDSAGIDLANTHAGRIARHFLKVASGVASPVDWSALIKSGFVLGNSAGTVSDPEGLDVGGVLEVLLIRDCLKLPDPLDLGTAFQAAKTRAETLKYTSVILKKLKPDHWQKIQDAVETLETWFACFSDSLGPQEALDVSTLASALRSALLNVPACREDGGHDHYQNLQGGEEVLDLLESLVSADGNEFSFKRHEIAPLFDTLLAPKRTRNVGRTHPRLHIYGTLEARLQSFDLVIIGGLNETIWPPSANNDPFLNRPMRSGLGLPLPERRIGLAAHDFAQLSGTGEVILTRSQRSGDAPSIASRWLQRLQIFVGPETADEMRERGSKYLNYATRLDDDGEREPPAARTMACPPVHARPNSLSITEIETWIRDPYAVYAKHVLKLYPLPPLFREADPALRGTLYHDIFARFIQDQEGAIGPASKERLHEIANQAFSEQKLPEEIEAVWRPRFEAVAESFLDWESGRSESLTDSICEVDGELTIPDNGFVLRGRADRIDVAGKSGLIVIDYKTGTNPTSKQARTLSPQLSLEGAISMRGGFKGVPAARLEGLQYVRLRPGDGYRVDDITMDRGKRIVTPDELAERALKELSELIIAYQNPQQGYISRYAPVSENQIIGDYDHLARVREWSTVDGSDEGDNS